MLVLALVAWAALLITCHLIWGWVPILDSANLAFHEAGHPILGLLSTRLAVYGGTLMQLLMPAAAAFEMHRQGKAAGKYFCLIWLAESLLNVARYMADARAHMLPLVNGIDPEYSHDWTIILSRWGLLHLDTSLAWLVRIVALGLMGWTLWRAWQASQRGSRDV